MTTQFFNLAAVTNDTLLGCGLILCAVTALVGLVLWSRKRINQICDSGPRSAREILHDIKEGTLGDPKGGANE